MPAFDWQRYCSNLGIVHFDCEHEQRLTAAGSRRVTDLGMTSGPREGSTEPVLHPQSLTIGPVMVSRSAS